MNQYLLKVFKGSVIFALIASTMSFKVMAAETYQPGATVVKDELSPSGYTVHFVYKDTSGRSVESVSVTGPFQYVDPNKELKAADNQYGPDQYVNGMYATNFAPGAGMANGWGYTETMVYNPSTGQYEADFPITSGSYAYSYIVKYAGEDAITIDDPANPSPAKNNGNSDIATGDSTHSIVYGRYDANKQSKSLNLDYVLPSSGNKGTQQYVEYTGNLSSHQDLGIYLPSGYDKNREKPYKVIYASHGGGGNETDWFAMGHADNIMDNLISSGQTEEAIVVTMDNASYNWDFAKIEDNVLHYIIPYMETNYNVSASVNDRAFCGLSMGGMTTTHMYFDHPDAFGYFGIFSGTDMKALTDKPELSYPIVTATVGTCDIASATIMSGEDIKYEDLVKWAADNSMNNFIDGGYLYGAHDWFVWAQSFQHFVQNIVWSQNNEDIFTKELLNNNYAEVGHLAVSKLSGDPTSLNGVYHVDEGTQNNPCGLENNGSSMYFIVDENKTLLIDAGNGFYSEDFKVIMSALSKNRTLEVAITHNHGDHIGELKNKTIAAGTRVYISEADYNEATQSLLNGYDVSLIAEGDTIDTAQYSLKAINLRGHTDGSIAYLDTKRQVLYSGDGMGSGFVWLLFTENPLTLYEADMNALYNTVKEMEQLTILPGHAWQQTYGELAPGEKLDMQYIKDMLALLQAIKDGHATMEDYLALNREGDVAITYNGLKATIDTTRLAVQQFTAKPSAPLEDEKQQDTSTVTQTKVADTGDATSIIGLAGVSILALAGAFVLTKKKKI